MFVTEDTTRALPEHLAAMYITAARSGATRLCLADTVGHATPSGVQRLALFLHEQLQSAGFGDTETALMAGSFFSDDISPSP
jgi:2-isopropylmalate synthase